MRACALGAGPLSVVYFEGRFFMQIRGSDFVINRADVS
jgi:hypothetical protein